MTWMISALVTGGTALSACAGQFRHPGTMDVVMTTSGVVLNLFSLLDDGQLTCVSRQPVLCSVKEVQVLRQESPDQLDKLLMLLETGNLCLLQYDQYFNRFITLSELNFCQGSLEASQLGHRLAVPTYGPSIAVAAASGRFGCLRVACTCPEASQAAGQPCDVSHAAEQAGINHAGLYPELQKGHRSPTSHGMQQLKEPVVYAATVDAPRIAGARALRTELHQQMELDSITDMAFFSKAVDDSCMGTSELQYLAVLSHRGGEPENLTKAFIFTWNSKTNYLRKIATVVIPQSIPGHILGPPLRVTAVPGNPSAMVLIAAETLLLLDFTEVLQPSRVIAAAAPMLAGCDVDWDNAMPDLMSWWHTQEQPQHGKEDQLYYLQGVVRVYADPKGVAAQHVQDSAAEETDDLYMPQGPDIEPEHGAGPIDAQALSNSVEEDDDAVITVCSTDPEPMDEGETSSAGDEQAVDFGAILQVDDAPITAWTWMQKDAAGVNAAGAKTDVLVLATRSGSLVRVIIENHDIPRSMHTATNYRMRSMIARIHQLHQFSKGFAEVLLALPHQQLLVVSDNRSNVLLLKPVDEPSTAGTSAAAAARNGEEQNHEAHMTASPSEVLQQHLLQLVGRDTSAAAASPHSSSTERAAGSYLGSAAGRLEDLHLESSDCLPQQVEAVVEEAETAAEMELDSLIGAASATAGPSGASILAAGLTEHQMCINNSAAAQQATTAAPAAATAADKELGAVPSAKPLLLPSQQGVVQEADQQPDRCTDTAADDEQQHHKAYQVASKLQLLGPVESFAILQQQQQQQQLGTFSHSLTSCGATNSAGSRLYNSGNTGMALFAASSKALGGLQVLTPGRAARKLQSGPVGMLDSCTGMFPIQPSLSSTEDIALVVSFPAASRALSVGESFMDVSNIIGLVETETTVLAACVAEWVAVQVTPSSVRLCCLETVVAADADGSSTAGGRGYRRQSSTKYSRTLEQQQQQQQQQLVTSQDLQAVSHDEAPVGAASTKPSAATAAAHGSQEVADAGMQRVSAPVGSIELELPATNGPGATHITGRPSSCTAGEDSNSSSSSKQQQQQRQQAGVVGSQMAQETPSCAQYVNQEWSAQSFKRQQRLPQQYTSCAASDSMPIDKLNAEGGPSLQQQQQHQEVVQTSVVLAATSAQLVLVYLNTSDLVMLQVSCRTQQQQQQQANQSAAAATAAAAAGQSGAPNVCRKRTRQSWSLVEIGSVQLKQQLSCLQLCSATDFSGNAATAAAAAANCRTSPQAAAPYSHHIIAGCYTGAVQVLGVQYVSSSSVVLHKLSSFDAEQLHPLRLLLRVTAGPSSRAAAEQSVPSAVPESCLIIPRLLQTPGYIDGLSAASSSSNTSNSSQNSAFMEGTAASLLVLVSFRNGDIGLYDLSIPQQQQQPASTSSCSGIFAEPTLRTLSHIRIPGSPPKLQLLNHQGLAAATAATGYHSHSPDAGFKATADAQHCYPKDQCVLAVSDNLWLLKISGVSHQVAATYIAAPASVNAVALQLPPASVAADAAPTTTKQHQQQQSGDVCADEVMPNQVCLRTQQQHLACVLPNGQLQLLQVPLQQQPQQHDIQRWMDGIQVSKVLHHPQSQLLLAVCSGPCSPPQSNSNPLLQTQEDRSVCWLQCLDPSTGVRLAAYQPSGTQKITSIGFWSAAADAFAVGPWPQSDVSSSPEQQQQLQLNFGTPGSCSRGLASAVRSMFGRRTGGTTGPARDAPGGSPRTGADASTPGYATLTAMQQQLRTADLLRHSKGQESSPIGTSRMGLQSRGLGGTSGHTAQRVGPLVVLGTEVHNPTMQSEGCKGQVVVLRLLSHSGSNRYGSPGAQSSAAAAAAAAGGGIVSDPCANLWTGATADGHHAAAATAGPEQSYCIQRVARLRMPEPVTAVCGFSGDLLLVAVGTVLAVYQIQQEKLQKAAHCFARAAIVSLTVADADNGIVLAADMFQGVAAYQVQVHDVTGQVSVQPTAAHSDVRRVSQVACLPPVPLGHRRKAAEATSSCYSSSSNSTAQVEHAGKLGRMHALCLDSHGYALEVAWAKQRTVPTKTLVTVACMPLGGAAAALQSPAIINSGVSTPAVNGASSRGTAGSIHRMGSSVYDLRGSEDICTHWQSLLGVAMPALSSTVIAGDAGASAVVAVSNGVVLHLQKLPAVEGRMLLYLQRFLLQHPWIQPLCIGGCTMLQQQGAASAGAPALHASTPSSAAFNTVDARVLHMLLLLPQDAQQQILQQAALAHVLSGRALKLLQEPCQQQRLLDAVLCRLQLLPSWEQ